MSAELAKNVLFRPDLDKKRYDMVIVGSGPTAMSLAGVVAERYPFLKVLVMEQKNQLGGDGHSSQQQYRTFQDAWQQADMVQATIDWYKKFSTLHQLPYLFITRSTRNSQNLETHFELVQQWGYGAGGKILTADEVKRIYPFIDRKEVVGGLYYKEAGQMDFNLAINEVTKNAQNTTFALETPMAEVHVQKGKVVSIKTARGTVVNSGYVVLAPGAFILKSQRQIIGGDLGLNGEISDYFKVQKRQTFSADLKGLPANTNIFLVAPGKAYVRLQTGSDGTGVGQYGFAEPTESVVLEPQLDPVTDHELFPYKVYSQLATIMSGYDQSKKTAGILACEPKFARAGYYVDPLHGHLPVISKTAIDGLYIMTGFSHAGVMMARGAAEKMSGIIFERQPDDEFSLYRSPQNKSENGFQL